MTPSGKSSYASFSEAQLLYVVCDRTPHKADKGPECQYPID